MRTTQRASGAPRRPGLRAATGRRRGGRWLERGVTVAVATGALATAAALGACRPATSTSSPAVTGFSAPAGAAASDEVSDAVAAERSPYAGVECGEGTCADRAEVCCGFSGEEGCARREPLAKGASRDDWIIAQVATCQEQVKSEYSLDSISVCDDSDDCAAGEVCCGTFLWGGAGSRECVPARADGSLACDFAEWCRPGTCRTRDTTCRAGSCERVDRPVRCGGELCPSSAPICCERPTEGRVGCVAACVSDDNSPAFEIECSSPASCPPGAVCQAGLVGSHCGTLVDGANSVLLCESDADCASNDCTFWGSHGPSRCATGHKDGFTHCSCD